MCTLAHYPVFPARICVGISLAVCHFRLYHLELLKRGKCFVVVLVYAHTDSGAFGGTYRAVGIIQSMTAPVTPANVSRNSGLRNILALPA